jgi:hypothetical protein
LAIFAATIPRWLSSKWQQLAEVLKMDGTLMLYQQFSMSESRASQGFRRFPVFLCQLHVSNPSRRWHRSSCLSQNPRCSYRNVIRKEFFGSASCASMNSSLARTRESG